MGLFCAPKGWSQTRVPGLALSCPYHCTSASSEHRGLLGKQLSLKDLQRKRDQDHTDLTEQLISKVKFNEHSTIIYKVSSVHLLLIFFSF